MMQTVKNRFLLEMYQTTNRLIYFLKRMPVLKKIIPERAYRMEEFKFLFAIYTVLQKLAMGMFGNVMYLFLLLLPSLIFLDDYSGAEVVYNTCFGLAICSLLYGPFFYNKIYDESEQSFVLIKVFRMDAKAYAVYNVLAKETIKTLWFVPALIAGAIIGGLPWLFVPMVFLELLCLRFFGAAVLMKIYERLRNPNNKLLENILAIVFLCLAIAAYIIPVALGQVPDTAALLINPLFLLLCLLLGGSGIWRLLSTPAGNYHRVLNRLYTVEVQMKLKKTVQSSAFADVKLNEKKFKQTDLNSTRFESKKSFDYLNAIFFDRHRNMIWRPMWIETLVVLLLGVALGIGTMLAPDVLRQGAEKTMEMYSVFAFILYAASTAPRMTRAMFYNCDMSLLHYSYYRTKQAVLATFRYRLRRVVACNLIPILLLAAELIVILPYNGIPMQEVLLLALVLILLSLFFSVHFLFLYYILQPYTEELNTKNPLFGLVNGITYGLCFFCWMSKPPTDIFVVVVLILTVLYIPTALLAVAKYAPKTFRLK